MFCKSQPYRYNQQSAQAASVSAMYEYGNNTAELAERYLQLAKQATSAKQFKNAKSWEQAASELATSSAKQAQQYTYAASKLGAGLGELVKRPKKQQKRLAKQQKTQRKTSKSTTKECQSCQIWTHSTHTEETKKGRGVAKHPPF